MKRGRIVLKGLGLFALSFTLVVMSYAVATSATIADFYKGKNFTFLVPNSPGGGYDTMARLIAPYLGKYLGANVVVLNKPGASGLVGANYLYTQAKPDGLTIAICQTFTVLMDEILGDKGVKYDSKRFKWLARASFDDYMVTVGKSSPYQSLDSIKKAPRFKIGLDARTATNGAGATAFCLANNLENVNIVVGYAGSSEVRLAILKGEVDGTSGSVSTQLRLLQSGDLTPISVIGFKRCRFFPEIPTVYEQNPKMSPETKKWVDTIITLTGLGRGLYTSPGVPEDKANFLRDIIKRTLSDAELIQKVEKAGFTVDYLAPGDYVKEMDSMRLSPEDRVKFKYLLMEKYPG